MAIKHAGGLFRDSIQMLTSVTRKHRSISLFITSFVILVNVINAQLLGTHFAEDLLVTKSLFIVIVDLVTVFNVGISHP